MFELQQWRIFFFQNKKNQQPDSDDLAIHEISNQHTQNVFGDNYSKHIKKLKTPPKLRSDGGRQLGVLGKINLVMMLGTDVWVIVQEGAARIFLLCSDIFYNCFIFDRGNFIKFEKGTLESFT